jgi:hypothetical protein
VGVLHDAKEDDPALFGQEIDGVLQDLLKEEKEQVLKYIDQLSKDRTLPKGEQKREHVERMHTLDLVPSYIKIFDKYDNCKRFLNNSVGKSPEELCGYYAVAVLCFDIAIKTHKVIEVNLNSQIKKFFEDMKRKLGGPYAVKELAEQYYKL